MRLRNHSTSPFRGWIRTTTDTELSGPVSVGAVEIVPARRIGLDVHAVDVWCHLSPNEALELDLEHAQPSNWWPPQAPADPVAHFGGEPMLNGAPMLLVGYAQDGAAWRAHYAVRFGRMFLCDLWLRWYPDQPAIVEAECMVTCSNADVPDMGEVLPDFRLTWGDSWQIGALPKASMRFADGQARAFPLSFVWKRHLRTALDWSTAGCIVNHQIGAVGVSRLLPGGNPTLPADFNLPAWAAQHWQRSQDILTTWEHPQLGPTANTAQAGNQECQCFTGGEPFVDGGAGAEFVRWCAALAYSGHPCHHYEKDGTVVDRDRRPGVRMFHSRPHETGSDMLGKPRYLSNAGERDGETGGWNGPDAQHLWLNTLAVAARLKDTPAVQRMLECQARNFLIQFTTTPGWSTSAIWSAREIGLVSMAALDLWRSLEDRGLAARVKAHFNEWLERIVLPHIAKTGPIWRVEKDAPSVGPGEWWQLWQHALAAYGLDLACEHLCEGELQQRGRAAALACAALVLERGWTRQGGRLIEYEQQRVDGTAKTRGADTGTSFAIAWMALAPATVLRHESGNALAREVWQQIVADANGDGRWLEPGVLHAR